MDVLVIVAPHEEEVNGTNRESSNWILVLVLAVLLVMLFGVEVADDVRLCLALVLRFGRGGCPFIVFDLSRNVTW